MNRPNKAPDHAATRSFLDLLPLWRRTAVAPTFKCSAVSDHLPIAQRLGDGRGRAVPRRLAAHAEVPHVSRRIRGTLDGTRTLLRGGSDQIPDWSLLGLTVRFAVPSSVERFPACVGSHGIKCGSPFAARFRSRRFARVQCREHPLQGDLPIAAPHQFGNLALNRAVISARRHTSRSGRNAEPRKPPITEVPSCRSGAAASCTAPVVLIQHVADICHPPRKSGDPTSPFPELPASLRKSCGARQQSLPSSRLCSRPRVRISR